MQGSNVQIQVAARIRELMRENNLNQVGLAEKTGAASKHDKRVAFGQEGAQHKEPVVACGLLQCRHRLSRGQEGLLTPRTGKDDLFPALGTRRRCAAFLCPHRTFSMPVVSPFFGLRNHFRYLLKTTKTALYTVKMTNSTFYLQSKRPAASCRKAYDFASRLPPYRPFAGFEASVISSRIP